jgi:ankyrin repeat protein
MPAGELLHNFETEICWKWAIIERHHEVVGSLLPSVGSSDLDWAVVNIVGSIERAKNGNILRLVAGDKDILHVLLSAGGDPCATDFKGTSALVHAVTAGQTGVVRTLLRGRDHPQEDLSRALQCALWENSTEIATLLLLHGAEPPVDIRAVWRRPNTLEFIAEAGNWALFTSLLNRNLRISSIGGRLAGKHFAEAGNLAAIKKMVSAGFRMTENILRAAAEAGQTFVIDEFFTEVFARLSPGRRTSFDDWETTVFLTACELGRVVLVEKVLPFITNVEREAGLTRASRKGRYQIVQLLLQDEVSLEGRRKALHLAAQGGFSLVFQLLLHPDVIGDREQILEKAVEGGNLDIVRKCLTFSSTRALDALRLAARKGHWEIAELLLKAIPVGSSEELDWAFYDAGEGGNVHILDALWKRGVDVSYDDDHALRAAAVKGHANAVKALLAMGAKADVGKSVAIRTATVRGHVEVVQEFLAAGCVVDGVNGEDLLAAARVNNILIKRGDIDWVDEYGSLESM